MKIQVQTPLPGPQGINLVWPNRVGGPEAEILKRLLFVRETAKFVAGERIPSEVLRLIPGCPWLVRLYQAPLDLYY